LKVLIITYYWPPAGGSGVQRWLKFVKYLQGFNIQPIVYTISNPRYLTIDDSLLNEIPENIEVLKHPIWEPTDLLFWKKNLQQNSGISNTSKSSFLSFIRGRSIKTSYLGANRFTVLEEKFATKFWNF